METENEIERRFEVGPRSELSVSNTSGHISIRAGGEGVIVVRAVKGGSSRAIENTQIDLSQTANRVNVQTKNANIARFNINLGRNIASVQYEIEVPMDCEVRAKGVSSEIGVTGIRARVSAQTVSGDVSLQDIVGDCSVTTVSGDLIATGMTGPFTMHTTSGDGTIVESELRSFNLHSVSGDFSVDTPLRPGEHYLAHTVSGDLQLLLPANTGATVQMKSVSGDVVSDLPAQVIKSGRRHWQGRINGGGASVEMNSVSGDMRIGPGRGDGARATPRDIPAAVVADGAPETSSGAEQSGASAVLTALERGEITVEEAMMRLEALR